MEIKVVAGDITELAVDAIIVNLFEGVKSPGGATGAVDKALDGAISRLISRGEIKGKLNEVTQIHTLGKIKPETVVVVGLGKQEDFNLDKVRSVTSTVCRMLRKAEARRVATILHGAGAGGIGPEKSAQAITEGALLGLYTFRQYITKDPEYGDIDKLSLVEREESKIPALEASITKGRIMAESAILARDMVNQPANFMTPTHMAERAREVAETWGLGLEVLEREDMEKQGMGALLGVAQGSSQPPKFIILTYRGDESSDKAIGFVGKGITFDSGGISIKPSEKMDEMKGDMAGGASVIATMRALGELEPKVNVTGLIPATENLPSGNALKPGDILRVSNGKTIEVLNTDAEGRLILADALSYANKLELSPILDVATLTGACVIALADICSGVFSNDQDVSARILRAGEEAGEKSWQMPMYEEYGELIKSEIADIKNTGDKGRGGGAITAAKFLAEFAGDTPWAHLDIAGTFLSNKERGYLPKGATGIPVRTLVNFTLSVTES
ncbi:MAG: leucyl aminopeptidase [Dehalococcoidia bacterium]